MITKHVTNSPQYTYDDGNPLEQSNSLDETFIPNPKYPFMPPGIQFYFYGNLIVNVVFLW